MTKQILAIANCRVSSDEQLKNNSLSRQKKAVIAAAAKLGVHIPDDGWWEGSVSSKRGGNLKRKDIQAMLEYCKKHPAVKYLLVDEPDRFMRSVDEAIYYEVEFQKHEVRVWYASDDDLNSNNMQAKLMKFMKYFVAEGSNEERQHKSVNGLAAALRDGRWPFPPPVGYRKGYTHGLPEIDPARGLPLRDALLAILEYRMTPSMALAELNKSDFVKGKAKYKMDKFRATCTNPFYAGVVEMNKQVIVRNENGMHEPLITLEQHGKLVEIFSKKKKSQTGPRKNGNDEYPLSNLVHCEACLTAKNGRYVGFKVNNGVNKERVYHKYRCRSCGQYFTREDLHKNIRDYVGEYQLTKYGRGELLTALNAVWKARRKRADEEKIRLSRDISTMKQLIDSRVDAAIQPENLTIKDDIMRRIETDKAKLADMEQQYDNYDKEDAAEKERFIAFALERAENMQAHFMQLPKPRLLQCKQLLFPSGFWIDANKKVYTPELSILTRLASNKKDLPNPEKSFMVRVKRL